ncbi:F-box domain-containing protein [Mycena sanguinolenta]|uniref:F-box domain-containing protein n=1 Tax=Mycena sanguinolenta TaxID=230812 RepID=A0A8H7DJC5_9AGAR|nr:F-box domain-containing protein [Mycena sanguinolenta]
MSPCCLPRVVAGPNMVGLDRRSRRHGHVDGGRPIQRSCAPPAVLPCSHSPRSPTFHRPLSILSSRNTLNRGLLLGSRHVQLRGRALGSLGLALAQLVRLPQLLSSMVVVQPSVPYYLDCRSLLAPIRRLPSEILIDVFQLCRLSEPEFSSSDRARGGMAHLAQEPLLRVSQVCIVWHTIVMGTPRLWDTVCLHASAFWGTPQQNETTMGLLRLAFERSGTLPLNVEFDSFEGHARRYVPALELIASHSARWKSVKIVRGSSGFGYRYLAGVKANLPLLRTLELNLGGAALEMLDFLRFVPNVKNLTVHGSIEFCTARLPLEELVTYECTRLQAKAIAWAVASMSRLSHPCAVRFEAFLDHWDKDSYSRAGGLQLPQTSSNMSSLSLEVTGLGREVIARCLQTFEEIFAALTLPSLRELSFKADSNMLSLPWPHSQFMVFSIRSSFHSHLHSLNLLKVAITESQLVDCLATLPALQYLSIADRADFHKTLVTTTLLTALTRTPKDSACLVPRLWVLECTSYLRFDDSVYLGFLVSRCELRASNRVPFVNHMHCPWTLHQRVVDSNVATRIQDLCAQGALTLEWLWTGAAK